MDFTKFQSMLVSLIGTIAVIDLVVIFLEVVHSFSKIRGDNSRWKRVLFYGVLGGLFGIYATISGYEMDNGIVVTIRDAGAMMAGFIGGPIAGLIAGGIAGIHRLLIGLPNVLVGTTIPCSIATVLIGLISGLISKQFKKQKHQPLWAFLFGTAMECMHLLLVLLYEGIYSSFADGLAIIAGLWLPLILCNAIAFALIVYIQNSIRKMRINENHTKQIESELNVANNIQDSMLPKIFPDFPGRKEFTIFATMQPAKEVGGDFYDFFFIDKNHFAFLIADVSGKGIPAALFMVVAKTLIKTNVQSGLSLGDAMTKTNLELLEGNKEQMFVTCWIGLLEISTGKLTYVNCGHNPPLIKMGDKPLYYLKDISGFVLAGSPRSKYKEYTTQLTKGDRLFLYTDGITEAMDIKNNQYGEHRLIEYLNNANLEESPNGIVNDVTADVKKFTNGIDPSDDMTMLAILINGFYNEIEVEAITENFEKVSEYAEQYLQNEKVPEPLIGKMNVVIDELFSNVVKYSGSKTLFFSIFIHKGLISMKFKYHGNGFDVTKTKEPDVNAPLDERPVGGLGLFIVKKICDNVGFETDGKFDVVTVDKKY